MKRALLIGINYMGSPNELKGCVNDICDIYRLLKDIGYTYFNILVDDILPDDIICDRLAIPTRGNIIAYIKSFISCTLDGDQIYIHYSGHGSQIKSITNDESDGMDEVLVPVDYNTNGIITDNLLRSIIIFPLLKKIGKIKNYIRLLSFRNSY
jgi:metacaspase-1